MEKNETNKHKIGDLVMCKNGAYSGLGTVIEINVVPYYGVEGFEELGIKETANTLQNIYNVLWSDSSITWHLEWEIFPPESFSIRPSGRDR
jgi:hypothetical protein